MFTSNGRADGPHVRSRSLLLFLEIPNEGSTCTKSSFNAGHLTWYRTRMHWNNEKHHSTKTFALSNITSSPRSKYFTPLNNCVHHERYERTAEYISL